MTWLLAILKAIPGLVELVAKGLNAEAGALRLEVESLRSALRVAEETHRRHAAVVRELEAALERERRWRREGASAGDRMDELLGGEPDPEPPP